MNNCIFNEILNFLKILLLIIHLPTGLNSIILLVSMYITLILLNTYISDIKNITIIIILFELFSVKTSC